MNPPTPSPAQPETIESLRAIAARVLDAQRDAMTAIGEIELAHLGVLPEITRIRSMVAVTLLKASCDFGLAASTLLAMTLQDFVPAALVLHRTQIETYARGLFFKSAAATDDELRRFVRNGKMPRRTGPNGKSTTTTAAEVLQAAAHAEGMDAAKLQGMMDNVWNGLCGVVHGGRPLLQTYRTVDTIGASFDARAARAVEQRRGAHDPGLHGHLRRWRQRHGSAGSSHPHQSFRGGYYRGRGLAGAGIVQIDSDG